MKNSSVVKIRNGFLAEMARNGCTDDDDEEEEERGRCCHSRSLLLSFSPVEQSTVDGE